MGLLAALALAACGGQEAGTSTSGQHDPSRATALAEIGRLEGLIKEALTPAPCGTDPLRAMGRVGCHLDALKYEYLHRSDWPMNGDVDGPFPKDPAVRRAAAEAVARTLPLLRALVDCEAPEVRDNAISVLSNLQYGGPYAPKTLPPEWDVLARVFDAEFPHYVRFARSGVEFVEWQALELVVGIRPRSPDAWALVERALAGDARVEVSTAAMIAGSGRHGAEAHFTPLLLRAVLAPGAEEGPLIFVREPLEVVPDPDLAGQMKAALASGDDDVRSSVLTAVATPICRTLFEASVLAIVTKPEDDWMKLDAARSLVAMGHDARVAVPVMVQELARDRRDRRWKAMTELARFRIASPEAVRAIGGILDEGRHTDKAFLLRCVEALEACGRGVAEALSRLEGLVDHRDANVARRAREAAVALRS